LIDNRYTIINGILAHCDEKLERLNDSNNKRNKNYIQVIGSSVAQNGIPKIGNLTGKFENLKELDKFIAENFKESNIDYIPKIPPHLETSLVHYHFI
jgi:hypothetical protein